MIVTGLLILLVLLSLALMGLLFAIGTFVAKPQSRA
jgi:hypothetical protein